MAIGMGAALLGSAVIGGIGSAIGGSKQSKAATNVQQMVNTDNAANRAFQESIYNRNYGLIYPQVQQGQVAGNAIMELLGFGRPQAAPQPSAFGAYNGGFPQNAFNGGGGFQYGAPVADGWSPESYGSMNYGLPAPAPGGVTTAAPSARSAFDTYRGSTGYDFRFGEGMRGLQSAFSRNLESGAASKAAIRYGQGVASDEFARYMGYLTGQQQMGLGGASALAGVGQNFANNVVAGNQSATTAAANARLYAGNSSANMWNNLGTSFGMGIGALAKGF